MSESEHPGNGRDAPSKAAGVPPVRGAVFTREGTEPDASALPEPPPKLGNTRDVANEQAVRARRRWEESVRHLAQAHYALEPGITQVYSLRTMEAPESQHYQSVRLLEVNADTIPAGVRPLQFAAEPQYGIDLPSVIIEVTPEEFDAIQAGELKLPADWSLGDLVPRAADGDSEEQ